MAEISEKSVVETGAKLAKDVVVGPFCYIGPEVKIGAGTVIEGNVTIVGKTIVGKRCHIYPLAVIGTTENGESGQCQIGDDTTIREHVTICGGLEKPTLIGRNTLVMVASHVGPETALGDWGIFANCSHIGRGVVIEEYVRTSAFCYVEPEKCVGAYAFVAGYVCIDHDVPPFVIIQGSPFRVRGVNSHLLKQCGFGENDIRALKRIFRDLYNGSGQLNEQVFKSIQKEHKDNPHVQRVVAFLSGDDDA